MPKTTTALVKVSGDGKKENKQYAIPAAMWQKARELLTERGVVSRTDLDELLNKYAEKVPDDVLESGRRRRLNLVDHTKAQLTKRGEVEVFYLGTEAYYVWWPVAGHVHGKNVMNEGDVQKMVREIVAAAHREM